MAITYCNTTSDLTNAYRDIDRYKGYFELDSTKWGTAVSGNIYRQYETGYVAKLFENGAPMTAHTSSSLDAAGKFYYDSTNDALYVWCTGNVDPDTLTIEAGETWSTFKTTCRNDAQEMLEGMLSGRFIVPFQKIIAPKESYNSSSYDFWIVRATALLTCYLIVKRLNIRDSVADLLYKEVDNANPEIGEQKGIVQKIIDNEYILKTQTSNREPGGFNVYEKSDNTSTAFAKFTGYYTGSTKENWRIQIDGAGAAGTATFKWSRDGGSNWDQETQDTRKSNSDNRRISLGSGIHVEFVGTFGDGDYWDLELFPDTDMPTVNQIHTVRISR